MKSMVILSCCLLLTLASIFVDAQAQAYAAPLHAGKGIDPGSVLGVAANDPALLPGISWIRMGYITCGAGNMSGVALKNAIHTYQSRGIHVLLTICQPRPAHLLDQGYLTDAAQGGPDAAECGNEEMKNGPYNIYIPPQRFAAFYDLCQRAVHAVNPSAVILLGSLDPHVAGSDTQLLLSQVHYLDVTQQTMNSQIHKGGHWTWRSQIVGQINSWHDGYPSLYTNNLRGLFDFWAREFQVNLSQLGNHMWVVEDTGCFKGCGIDMFNRRQVAIAHILALIVDVQTAKADHVPFFFFSEKDFFGQGVYWPIGLLSNRGLAKPLRQDLPMGSRALWMTCGAVKTLVMSQERLLVKMYQGCRLPNNWYATLV